MHLPITRLFLAPSLLISASIAVQAQGITPLPYLDARLSVEKRVDDLIARMTLEEKVAQLRCITKDVEAEPLIGPEGVGGIGPILRSLTELGAAAKVNRIQQLVRAKTRLGIPVLFHDEALHGLVGRSATSFPQAIGLAATWDPEFVGTVAAVIGKETRARGIRQVLSPVINIARDVRWGRVEETYGEDPFLTSAMGTAYCAAVEREGVLTTPKHFAANVGDGGRDSYPIHFSERILREVYLPAFEACIRKGHASSVMASYNALDGLPASANPWLLTELLRDEWGFQGFVVSDYGSAAGIMNKHFVAENETTAAALALNAGLDVELPDVYIYGPPLVAALRNGSARMAALETSVRRILRAKFLLGLFDSPPIPIDTTTTLSALPAHKALALEAARKSIVLLKNDERTLPLSKSLHSLAVIGPAADTALLGGYSGFGSDVVTVLRGIREKFGQKTLVRFSKGCAYGFGALPPIPSENLIPPDGAPGERGLKGEYFDNPTLSGNPVVVRREPRLHFEWQMGSPDPKVPVERFSARWTGKLLPTVSGTYRLGVSTDDGVRLTLDGKLLINSWYDRGATLDLVTLPLEAGRLYDLKVEYYENVGWTHASLVWELQQKEDPLIAESVELARQSDAVVLVPTITEGEGYDRSNLDLPGRQEELIRAVAAVGKPTVVVLLAGSAVTMRSWKESVGAILAAWYPGEQGGHAVADVLAGDLSPAGRLPITFPQAVGQLPLYYNPKPTGRGNDYSDLSGLPLFPFGHGLSYTTFKYGNLYLGREEIPADGSTTLSVDVTNTGPITGDEVVQLYIHRPHPSITQPVKELRGFRRITLAPGATKTVSFHIGPEELALLDRALRWTVEPGEVELLVGSSSADIREKTQLRIHK